MRCFNFALLGISLLAASQVRATVFVGSVPGAPDPGATGDFVIDFEGALLPNGIVFAPGSTYSILQGLVPHQGYNPAGDNTHYLALPAGNIAEGSATLDFSGYSGPTITDFSFYWGSIDRANILTVTSDLGTLTLSGAELINAGYGSATSARGNRRVYFALTSGEMLTSLFFSSPTAFEIDDIEFHTVVAPTPAPEPASWASMLLGFGLAGAVMRRSRATSAHRAAQA
jgi:hypothetical protein